MGIIEFLRKFDVKGDSTTILNQDINAFYSTYWSIKAEHAIKNGIKFYEDSYSESKNWIYSL